MNQSILDVPSPTPSMSPIPAPPVITSSAQPSMNLPTAQYFQPLVDTSKPLFTVTDAQIVALWSWNSSTETCAICHESLLSPCIACNANIYGNQKCTLTWSECSHGYHSHCIKKWIAKRDTCPLCNAQWAERTIRGE